MVVLGYSDQGLQLDALRALLQVPRNVGRLSVHSVDDGYIVGALMHGGVMVWLVAERSKKVRIFKRADTALSLCRQLGFKTVQVELTVREIPLLSSAEVDQ